MFAGCRPIDSDELRKIDDYFDDRISALKSTEGLEAFDENKLTHVLCLRDRLYFQLGITSGFRVSEMCNIRLKDCWDFDRDRSHLYMKIDKSRMKGKRKDRVVKLSNKTREYLEHMVKNWEAIWGVKPAPECFLFRGFSGDGLKPLHRTTINKMLLKICHRIGIDPEKFGTHSLRKTLAKSIYDKTGGDIVSVCSVLGHSDPKSTLKYLQANRVKVDEFLLDN